MPITGLNLTPLCILSKNTCHPLDISRFADGTFDAVLCSGGPLSHILDRRDRSRAIGELVRVAKPDAPLFVSVMGRLSVLVFILEFSQDEFEMPYFVILCDTGGYC